MARFLKMSLPVEKMNSIRILWMHKIGERIEEDRDPESTLLALWMKGGGLRVP